MNTIKKILLVGAFSHDPSIYTYASSFAHSLQELAFDVSTFNYRAHILPRFLRTTDQYMINRRLMREAIRIQPDLIFLIKAETIRNTTLATIKKTHPCNIINFYPDNPFTFWNGNSTANVLLSLPTLDCFLAWSSMLVPMLYSAGSRHVCTFPFAYDKHIFSHDKYFDHHELSGYTSDVCFVGTWEPERELSLSHLITKIPNLNLAIWGNQWNDNCSNEHLKKYIRGNALYTHEMIKAFRAAKIVLNFIRTQNVTGHNMRTFEVPASKAFLLTEYSSDQAHLFFKENESIACFKSSDDLVNQVNFFLTHDQQRSIITHNSWLTAQKFSLTTQLQNYFEYCPLFNQQRNIYENGSMRQSSF